jgi:hypothetical protein
LEAALIDHMEAKASRIDDSVGSLLIEMSAIPHSERVGDWDSEFKRRFLILTGQRVALCSELVAASGRIERMGDGRCPQ